MTLPPYSDDEPTRTTIDALQGTTVLEFGADWCGWCQAAQPHVEAALAGRALRHLRVADGKGRPLGRSYGVKLWPTLIVVRDGVEVARVVRPGGVQEIAAAVDAS